MTLAIPHAAVELGAWALLLGALATGGAALVKIWRAMRNSGERVAEWLDRRVLGDLRADIAATKHIVTYHLGPNGGATPIHERVGSLEAGQRDHNAVAEQLMDRVAANETETERRHQETAHAFEDLASSVRALTQPPGEPPPGD